MQLRTRSKLRDVVGERPGFAGLAVYVELSIPVCIALLNEDRVGVLAGRSIVSDCGVCRRVPVLSQMMKSRACDVT